MALQFHNSFPRYLEFKPLVPVWCVTPRRARCIHRFFDNSPISPSGRYLAVFQLPFENRAPRPGEKGAVCLIDLATGVDSVLAETCGWEHQLGANINWGGSDEELYFNDVDTVSWYPFAWKLNPLTGDRVRLRGTVYHASQDGRWLISANLANMRRTQPGYGVVVPAHATRRNVGPVEDDGFFLTDTSTGEKRLLVSISDLLREAKPPVRLADPSQQEIYGFHCKFNPQCDLVMLSLRWFQKGRGSLTSRLRRKIDRRAARTHETQFAWLTMGIGVGARAGVVHCAVGPEQWRKGGHHATWFPDGRRISMNLNIDEDGMRFVQVCANGDHLRKMHDTAVGSGHPTVHPHGRYVLTDAYNRETVAFGDGTVPLRWVDLNTGQEKAVVRIHTQQPFRQRVLRVDPHPAWDRAWRYVAFNGFVGGTRRVFVADMAEVIDSQP